MNAHVSIERMQKLIGLREWAGLCRNVPTSGLPKLILHVCQALYDATCPGLPPIGRKLAVLNHVADGNYREAILAMLPAGFTIDFGETSFEAGEIQASARIFHPVSGLEAESRGTDRNLALLGCLAELALALDDEERERVLV